MQHAYITVPEFFFRFPGVPAHNCNGENNEAENDEDVIFISELINLIEKYKLALFTY